MSFGQVGDPKSKLFRAKYPGKCQECGDYFSEEDEIGYVDEDIVCSYCWEEL